MSKLFESPRKIGDPTDEDKTIKDIEATMLSYGDNPTLDEVEAMSMTSDDLDELADEVEGLESIPPRKRDSWVESLSQLVRKEEMQIFGIKDEDELDGSVEVKMDPETGRPVKSDESGKLFGRKEDRYDEDDDE